MSTPRRRIADLPADPSTPRKGRPPAPEAEARRHQIQVRVTERVEKAWRAFCARLQSEQAIGVVPQGDALAWLLDEEAKRVAAREAKGRKSGAGKG